MLKKYKSSRVNFDVCLLPYCIIKLCMCVLEKNRISVSIRLVIIIKQLANPTEVSLSRIPGHCVFVFPQVFPLSKHIVRIAPVILTQSGSSSEVWSFLSFFSCEIKLICVNGFFGGPGEGH